MVEAVRAGKTENRRVQVLCCLDFDF